MNELFEIEQDIVEAAINMACLGGDGRLGLIQLGVLDACVARVISARAKNEGQSVGDFMERRRQRLTREKKS